MDIDFIVVVTKYRGNLAKLYFASESADHKFANSEEDPDTIWSFQPKRNKTFFIFFFDSVEQKNEWLWKGFPTFKFED